jgi:hypothetical protein
MTTPARRGHLLLAGGVLSVMLAATPALAGSATPAPLLHPGKGNAIIHWAANGGDLVPGHSVPFSGTIAGVPLTGTAGLAEKPSFDFTGTGRLGSARFSVVVAFSVAAIENGNLHVTGTYGKNHIVGVVTMNPAQPHLVRFRGTVGLDHVSVTVHQPSRNGNTALVTASFVES